jgi:exosortase family protein XrtF
LKKYLSIYKPFLLFLSKFFISYLILTLIYQLYLGSFDKKTFEVDTFTQLVARQTVDLLRFANQNASTQASKTEPCMNFYYNKVFSSRVIEGCNALSIIILFIAFVIAFSGKWKDTAIFCISGSLLIHCMNIIRIALLNVATVCYKEQEVLLHDVFFPTFIYGVVFILWVIWINKFSIYATNSDSKQT